MKRRTTWKEWHAFEGRHTQSVIYQRWTIALAITVIAQAATIIILAVTT